MCIFGSLPTKPFHSVTDCKMPGHYYLVYSLIAPPASLFVGADRNLEFHALPVARLTGQPEESGKNCRVEVGAHFKQ